MSGDLTEPRVSVPLAIGQLSDADIERVYHEHMTADFPPDELKPLRIIKKSLRQGRYVCYGLWAAGELAGYAFYVRQAAPVVGYMGDYIGIFPDRRDSGLGTAFQRMLYDRALTDAQFLLNEVEDPDTAPDPAAKERMLRRIRHHARVGWQDTGVRVRTWGVDFRLMEYPLKTLHDPETVRRLYWGIYRLSLSERQCREHIVFHTD